MVQTLVPQWFLKEIHIASNEDIRNDSLHSSGTATPIAIMEVEAPALQNECTHAILLFR